MNSTDKRVIVWILVFLSGLAIGSLIGCQALTPQNLSVPAAWVDADRATFNVVAPIILSLSDADPANDPDLTGVNGMALRQVIETWKMRLIEAELALAPVSAP